MPTQASLPLSPSEPREDRALGICLARRDVGLALTTREHVLRSHVATLRRLPENRRPERAITEIWKLLGRY